MRCGGGGDRPVAPHVASAAHSWFHRGLEDGGSCVEFPKLWITA